MCQKYRKWQWAGQGSYGNCLNFVIVVLDPRDIDAEDREYISVFFFDRVFALRLKFTFKWTSPDGVRTTWTPLFQCMMVWSFTQGLLCHWLWAVIYAWKLVLWIHLIRNQHILCGFHSRLWVCKTLPSQSVCVFVLTKHCCHKNKFSSFVRADKMQMKLKRQHSQMGITIQTGR